MSQDEWGEAAEAKVKQAKDHDSRKESEEAPEAAPNEHDQRRRPLETVVGEARPLDRKPGSYQSLEVRVDKPGLVARTRQGYYVQP